MFGEFSFAKIVSPVHPIISVPLSVSYGAGVVAPSLSLCIRLCKASLCVWLYMVVQWKADWRMNEKMGKEKR